MNRLCAPWVNGREPARKKNIVPARLFRFTKTFTERCWSNRRSRHEFFHVVQEGRPQSDPLSAPLAAFDDHPRSIAIENLQTLGDVCHTDSHASQAIGVIVVSSKWLGGPHAHAVIFYLDHKP